MTLSGKSVHRAARALRLFLAVPVLFLGVPVLYGCGLAGTVEHDYPEKRPSKRGAPDHSRGEQTGVFGTNGISLLGGEDQEPGDTAGIGVNSFLWRASLDTISFMPLTSADPFGGVIITDWYTPPEVRDERFKITVYILGRDLRADGVRAAVFRQRHEADGRWIDATVGKKTATDLENAILTRARELRIAGLL